MSEVENTVEKKPIRIVTMNDGTKVDFGVRASLLTSIDVEESSLIFKVFTGETIVYEVENTENLTDFQKAVFLYGLLAKIKSNLAPVKLQEDKTIELLDEEGNIVKDENGKVVMVETGEKVNTMAIAINEQIENLKAGKFTIRGGAADEDLALSDEQKAYARAAFLYPVSFANKAWENITDPVVISDVIISWDNLERKERNAIRKNVYFMVEFAKLDPAIAAQFVQAA